jgi:hypothetical protein
MNQSIITPVRVEERVKLGIRPGDTVRVLSQELHLLYVP